MGGRTSLISDTVLSDALLSDAVLSDALVPDALVPDTVKSDAMESDAVLSDAMLSMPCCDNILFEAMLVWLTKTAKPSLWLCFVRGLVVQVWGRFEWDALYNHETWYTPPPPPWPEAVLPEVRDLMLRSDRVLICMLYSRATLNRRLTAAVS